ncbi:MAG: hypothetical protein II875_05990 [Clostridia bacterium]|nr:hypothetical protein [Clostridia bacterium]
MTNALKIYLDDIENRLNPEFEDEILEFWRLWGEHKKTSFDMPKGRVPKPSVIEWPCVNINDAIKDDELMVIREFAGVSKRLSQSNAFPLRVRANYGVANVASAFGCPLFEMPRETDTLPNAVKLGEDACCALIEKPIPDTYAGNFEGIFRMGKLYREICAAYPRIGKYVHIEQPDLQGPMDNLELLWGSDLFYALYDMPEEIHALLDKITQFISQQLDAWLELFPGNAGTASYFRHREKGSLALRDDSAMNLSPAFFEEFIAQYDQRLLKKYGGIVHFCGKGDHFIPLLSKLEGLNGINMSQPHLNDMQKVFANTIDKGIHLSLSINHTPEGSHDFGNLLLLGND